MQPAANRQNQKSPCFQELFRQGPVLLRPGAGTSFSLWLLAWVLVGASAVGAVYTSWPVTVLDAYVDELANAFLFPV